jgi:hypothetical protein
MLPLAVGARPPHDGVRGRGGCISTTTSTAKPPVSSHSALASPFVPAGHHAATSDAVSGRDQPFGAVMPLRCLLTPAERRAVHPHPGQDDGELAGAATIARRKPRRRAMAIPFARRALQRFELTRPPTRAITSPPPTPSRPSFYLPVFAPKERPPRQERPSEVGILRECAPSTPLSSIRLLSS